MVTSAKGKQECKNWHRYFSLTLFEFWYERNDNFFFSHENYLQKQPFADVLSKNLFLKISQYSQENTWRLEDLQNWCFSCDYLAVFKDFFTVHLGWLVLYTEWMFDAPLNQSIFCTTRNIFNQFNMDLYATGTIFWKHVILFCATLNIFRQHESSFGCHIIFFVATTYFFVAHIILLRNVNFHVKHFFCWHNSCLCNTRFFCAA